MITSTSTASSPQSYTGTTTITCLTRVISMSTCHSGERVFPSRRHRLTPISHSPMSSYEPGNGTPLINLGGCDRGGRMSQSSLGSWLVFGSRLTWTENMKMYWSQNHLYITPVFPNTILRDWYTLLAVLVGLQSSAKDHHRQVSGGSQGTFVPSPSVGQSMHVLGWRRTQVSSESTKARTKVNSLLW